MNRAEVVARFLDTPRRTPALRLQRQRLSKQLAASNRRTVLALAHALIRAGVPRFVAYELVFHHPPTRAALTEMEIEKLGDGMSSWDQVDGFAYYISGPAWRDGILKDATLHNWAKSGAWWWRRAALVSTVPLNTASHGGNGDPKRTLQVCRMLIADPHDMIVKALSWALRVLAKRDPESVKRFLARHDAALAARVRREVNNKLATGLKNPRA